MRFNNLILKSAGMASLLVLFSCGINHAETGIESEVIKVRFNDRMQSRISATYPDITPLMDGYRNSEYLITSKGAIRDFKLSGSKTEEIAGESGPGSRLIISGISTQFGGRIRKTVEVTIYDRFPEMAVFDVTYENLGQDTVAVSEWVNNEYALIAGEGEIPFWSFQSGSYEERPDWVLPVKPGFAQENYMGMNAADYGGGIPVSDIWRKDVGIGVGHAELVPKLVSLPVKMKSRESGAEIGVHYKKDYTLKINEKLHTFTTFVSVHRGDYFHTLTIFRLFMQTRGIQAVQPGPGAYEPVWCAWGYERDFTPEEILGTLPKVKALGFKWAVLDDGWQTAEGDWYLNPKKFPRGDRDMRKFVNEIHARGLKAKLWWAPLAVDPGTDLYTNHPDMLLINKEGKTQRISWWDSDYLCPAYPGTIEYTRKLVKKMIADWGYDGLKIDGQHLNAVPPCYNPAHHHQYPEESVEQLPAFYEMIYNTVTQFKKNAVVEICPCGTAGSFYNTAYMNQPVASDPTSSRQIRLKGKTYKAIMGPNAAYYGDHVELSDGQNDFASSVGIGAVIGTKFTWPSDKHPEKGYILTPEKEKIWKKWMSLYNRYELPKGNYLGELYDIGYDRPEAHVIEKNGDYFYAFYADEFSGVIQLRGLPEGRYQVTDYENSKPPAELDAVKREITVSFKKHLLLKATRVEK